jgi:hypothetical protein
LKNISSALSIHEKRHRKISGERYILGARYLWQNVLYVFVGYSLPPVLCVFDYCLFKFYTGLFISDEDKRMSMMNINLLWPRLHKGSHICLILSIFMTEQKISV